jgi:tRNA G18 (ribose-2'-O)-methylase SpoU
VTRHAYAHASRGFAAAGIWHPKTENNVGSLWRSASLYGCAFVFTVGRRYTRQASDTTRTTLHIPLLHFADVDDLIAHLPHSCPLIGIEMDPRARPLRSWTHPERGCYLLGAEDHGLPLAVLDRCHSLVQIESAVPQSMNVACAGSVLLHDRYAKSLQSVAARLP